MAHLHTQPNLNPEPSLRAFDAVLIHTNSKGCEAQGFHPSTTLHVYQVPMDGHTTNLPESPTSYQAHEPRLARAFVSRTRFLYLSSLLFSWIKWAGGKKTYLGLLGISYMMIRRTSLVSVLAIDFWDMNILLIFWD
jgi:hypothetical protein